jgi:hypothetical protein
LFQIEDELNTEIKSIPQDIDKNLYTIWNSKFYKYDSFLKIYFNSQKNYKLFKNIF